LIIFGIFGERKEKDVSVFYVDWIIIGLDVLLSRRGSRDGKEQVLRGTKWRHSTCQSGWSCPPKKQHEQPPWGSFDVGS
jgi:hypothetical protein